MNSTSPRLRLFTLIGCLAGLILALTLSSYIRRVEAACIYPSLKSNSVPVWAPVATVIVVYAQGHFSQAERNAMTGAFTNWSYASTPWGNNTGVTFSGFNQGSAPNYSTAVNVCYVKKIPNTGNAPAAVFGFTNSASLPYISVADIYIRNDVNWTPSWEPMGLALRQAVAHEIGHTFRLDDCYPACNGISVMGSSGNVYGPRACDNCAVKNAYLGLPATTSCATPTPTPTPTPNPTPTPPPGQNCTTAGWNGDCPPGTQPDGFGWCCAEAGCGGFFATREKSSGNDPTSNIINPTCCDDYERLLCYQGGGEWYESQCACYSPIVIDVAGNGFDLTSAASGVMFDLPGAGVAEQLSWTSTNSDDAWLALDRNGNGIIENGKELFGTFTAQPALAPGESKNGFRALAMFDSPAFGGNADGQIDSRDAIFFSLVLWHDVNHNGISEGEELRSLSVFDIGTIELSYKESRRKDENGNWFRYRSKVRDARGIQRGRWAWDVFLQKL